MYKNDKYRPPVMILTSGKASLNRRCSIFHIWLRAAYARFSASLVVTEPVVISSESIKDSNPVKLKKTRDQCC